MRRHKDSIALAVILGLFFFTLSYLVLPEIFAGRYDASLPQKVISQIIPPKEEEKPKSNHLPTPEPLKAIYMSSCVVGTPSFRDELVKLAEETEINAIVIDVKDFSGTLSFKPENPDLMHMWDASKCGASDMREFLKTLKEKNIYTIARITVFQDPHFTKLHPELAVQSKSTGSPWKDRKGLNFLDVGGKPTWEYVVAIAKETYDAGFDELNFDYIRYPSDGNMADAVYTLSTGSKQEQLEKFFTYLGDEMKKIGAVTSADLFGMTTTNTDDLNIGQVLERALPHFDYIAPMVYPSHYPANFNGWSDPNKVPYELIKFVMDAAVERTVATTSSIAVIGSERIGTTTPAIYTKPAYSKLKMRPWLQDFDYGGTYDVAEVRAQIKGTYDAGLTSWMLWAPSNRYTRGALQAEE